MLLDDNYGYDHTDIAGRVSITDPSVAKIERVRYLKSGFRLEFSYCIVVLKDGSKAYAYSGEFPQFSTIRTLKGDLLSEFKSLGLYAKGLGVFDQGTISVY